MPRAWSVSGRPTAANNYAATLKNQRHFEEAKSLMRKTIPVARRVLGKNEELMLMMRKNYAKALYYDEGATLDDLREAVETVEEAERIARRIFGSVHPQVVDIEESLRDARAALRAREE